MEARKKKYDIISKKPTLVRVNKDKINPSWMTAEYYMPKFLDLEKKISDFEVRKFNSIANINRVTGFQVQKHLKVVDDGIPYLRVSNIFECFINFNDMQYIPEEVHNKFKKSQFEKNDIALTITGRVGTAAIINDNGSYNACQDVVKISLNDKKKIDPYYLTIYLNSNTNYKLLTRFNSGGSRPRTLIGNVREVKIPIPSSKIQKYIGDKVKKAEKLREEAKNLKQKAEDELLELLNINPNKLKNDSKYHKINSDLVMNRLDPVYYQPKYTQLIRQIKEFSQGYNYLSEVLENTQIGKTPDVLYNKNNGYIPFVESSNISKNILKIDKNQMVSKEFIEDYDYKSAKAGDLLLAKDGATIGAVALVPEFIEHVMGNGHTLRLRLKNKIYSGFLYYFLSSELGYMQLNRESTGSAQAGLKKSFAENIIISDIDEETAQYYCEVENKRTKKIERSNNLIEEAKQDVEDLIEGNLEIEN